MEEKCFFCKNVLSSSNDVVLEVHCRVPDDPEVVAKAKETAVALNLKTPEIQTFDGYLTEVHKFCSYFCNFRWALRCYVSGEILMHRLDK